MWLFIWFSVLKAIKDIYTINPQDISMAVSQIAYLTYQTFCLGLLTPFAFVQPRQHIPETFCFLIPWYSAIRSSVLFNSILFYFAIFTPPSLNFFLFIYFMKIYILFWKFAACSFPICDWLKAPVLLYFEQKPHMINQKSKAMCDFLKIIYD